MAEAHARPVECYRLDNGRGLAVEVLTYGATLVAVEVPDRDGAVDNVVLRLPNAADYQDRAKNPYVGSTVGRYCRCVAGGAFTIDGVEHHLTRNAGLHQIHGGPEGFDRALWTAETETTADSVAVRLSLTSQDGDQGYPGTLTAETTYRLTADDCLVMAYRATTTAPTVVGFTNHAFWNLGGAGTIDGHTLALNAAHWVDADEDFIPLPGPPRPVDGTDMDYRAATPLDGRAIDAFFVFADDEWAADLRDPRTGRRMVVTTDSPGLGVYTGDFHPRPRTGLCLETGAFPDAPNRPDFPSTRLNPGEVYATRTVHRFDIA
ncbi:Aldose 1-epimerase [Alloactinosynnema sp. L-07]|nr:Aldose 1-epimerase [Alloactinosynnema sp. L-07]